ncbi:MAG: hypothetical protein QW736_06655, partial [Fervidicoccaceae archaeon]
KKSFSIGLIVRGHEPSDYGYKLQHNGTVLTLFSRMGPPYFNRSAAIAVLDLSNEEWRRNVLSSIQFIS